MPAPSEPHVVAHETVWPILQSKPSSMFPSQLSSTPLQISASLEGSQCVSHAPSPSRSFHPSLHRTAQIPLSQSGAAFMPAVHTLPQRPQLLIALRISTQLPLHAILPSGHSSEHEPSAQTSNASHSLPQAPQLPWSEKMSTHVPLQSVSPGAQVESVPSGSSKNSTSSVSVGMSMVPSKVIGSPHSMHAGAARAISIMMGI